MRFASFESFSAAPSVVLVPEREALQPPHAPLLLRAQAMGGYYARALCDTLVPSPRAVIFGQPAGAVPWSLERQATGSEEYRIWRDRSGHQAHAS